MWSNVLANVGGSCSRDTISWLRAGETGRCCAEEEETRLSEDFRASKDDDGVRARSAQELLIDGGRGGDTCLAAFGGDGSLADFFGDISDGWLGCFFGLLKLDTDALIGASGGDAIPPAPPVVILGALFGRSPIPQSISGAATPQMFDFHTMTNSSIPPEEKKFPHFENVAALIGPTWLDIVKRSLPSRRSQTFKVESLEEDNK